MKFVDWQITRGVCLYVHGCRRTHQGRNIKTEHCQYVGAFNGKKKNLKKKISLKIDELNVKYLEKKWFNNRIKFDFCI